MTGQCPESGDSCGTQTERCDMPACPCSPSCVALDMNCVASETCGPGDLSVSGSKDMFALTLAGVLRITITMMLHVRYLVQEREI